MNPLAWHFFGDVCSYVFTAGCSWRRAGIEVADEARPDSWDSTARSLGRAVARSVTMNCKRSLFRSPNMASVSYRQPCSSWLLMARYAVGCCLIALNPIATAQDAVAHPQVPPAEEEVGIYGGNLVPAAPTELTSVASDREGAIWMGSRFSGVVVLKDGRFTMFDQYNSPLQHGDVQQVFADSRNVKWFATATTLYSFDNKQWQTYQFEVPEIQIAKPRFERIMMREDSQQRLWISAGFDRAQYLFRLEKGKLQRIATGTLSRGFPEQRGAAPPLERILGSSEPFDIDRKGQFWGASQFGLLRVSGAEMKLFQGDELPPGSIQGIWCDSVDDRVFLVMRTRGQNFRNQYGLSLFKDGHHEPITHSDDQRGVYGIAGSADGRWAVCTGNGVFVGRGKDFKHYEVGRQLLDQSHGLCLDGQNRVWIASRFHGLHCLEGEKWKVHAPLQRRDINLALVRRMAWQRKYLDQLVREAPIDASIAQVLNDPKKYANQKIRIVGHIASGFEYAHFVDEKSAQPLGVWPSLLFANDWSAFVKNMHLEQEFSGPRGPDGKVSARDAAAETFEFLGYLEFGGHFGATFQFTPVEQYPKTWDADKKAEVKPAYLKFLETQKPRWPVVVSATDPEVRTARRDLAGDWEVVTASVRGESLESAIGSRWNIDRDRLIIESAGVRSRYRISLDPNRSPAAVDLLPLVDPINSHQHWIQLGLYRRRGDLLAVAGVPRQPDRWFEPMSYASRPSVFQSQTDDAVEYQLRRRPPGKQATEVPGSTVEQETEIAEKLRVAGAALRLLSSSSGTRSRMRDSPPWLNAAT